jgi:hypothetical protein
MEKKFVRPGAGPDGAPFVTRNPATGRPLSADGEWVDLDSTARRRLREGDWVEASAPAAAAELEHESLAQRESR